MDFNCQQKVLASTSHGQIRKCLSCNKFHIEFKNLQFNLSKSEFLFFKKCFMDLDAAYWEFKNKNAAPHKKILIDLNHDNISVRFSQEEIIELQELLSGSKMNEKFLKVDHIDADFCSN